MSPLQILGRLGLLEPKLVVSLELVEALADLLYFVADTTPHPHGSLHELTLFLSIDALYFVQSLILLLEALDLVFKVPPLVLHLRDQL